jgi:CRISPR-associated protein Csx17
MTKNNISLPGCTPEPLSSYLKALGVLRLLVEQGQDPKAKGYWQNDVFFLVTCLSEKELEQFFLHQYQPTPLVAPWNGSTGFYPKDNQKTIQAVIHSQAERLREYRQTITVAQQQVDALKFTVQPKEKSDKRRLLERLHNHLPNSAVKWLDTCALVTAEELKFPPLTGTGGNDGNFEFSRTFMQQLQELINFKTGQPSENSHSLLQSSIFNVTLPGLPFTGKIGQFNPIAAGGANAAPGYDADSRVNPWDYVLMLEGIMLFTSGITRRYEKSELGDFAYPFTVRASTVGYGSATAEDEARAELWIPLWSAPTGLGELQTLFSEGRAKVGGRTARDGVDFARALSSRGVNRGIVEFVRYSFQVRNGLSYFAIPLGRFQPRFNPQVDRLAEIDPWLSSFKRASQDTNAPASVIRAHRRLETTIIDLSQGKAKLLDILVALGAAEAALDHSFKFTKDKFLRPLPLLKPAWLNDCREDSPEFRLALALAGNGLRQRLVSVRQGERFASWAENEDKITTWKQGSLANNLLVLLKRQEIEAQQRDKQNEGALWQTEPPISTGPHAHLEDLVLWIDGDVDEERIEDIARGLCLIQRLANVPLPVKPKSLIPAPFALLAIAHHRILKAEASRQVFHRYMLPKDLTLPRVPALLGKLSAGDSYTASNLAVHRLHASGLKPALTEGMYELPSRSLRMAAALAFPISDYDLAYMWQQVRKTDPTKEID